jgi:hypothetical protein
MPESMTTEFRQRLRDDAAAGSKFAERLLLLDLLANGELGEIEALLCRIDDTAHRRYIEAELGCFHAWPCEQAWHELLRQSAEAGYREAKQVVSVYHDWALHPGSLNEDRNDTCRFPDGWYEWTSPKWSTVLEGEGLSVERSAAFIPPGLIGYLRSLLGPQLRPSAVIDPQTGQPIAHPARINRSAQWLPEQLGWIGKLFECRLAELGCYPLENGEVSSLLHYQPGQHYKAHVDCISRKLAESEQGVAEGGQRTHTLLLGLGDDNYVGGDTFFPRLDAGVRSSSGSVIRFNNVSNTGHPLKCSVHIGQPVLAGEKWLLSKWVRERSTPYGREIGIVQSAHAAD